MNSAMLEIRSQRQHRVLHALRSSGCYNCDNLTKGWYPAGESPTTNGGATASKGGASKEIQFVDEGVLDC
uniref:Uncharacterized protein n=1 Tax=Solanum lycopersicum TaxID=4081 RepID=A0A3Q7GQW9_SOLLC